MSRPEADPDWDGASELFRALGSPLRVRIITLLTARPRSVSELVEHLGVSQPLVSQHLKVLREQCLVDPERHGREMRYRLMDDHVGHIVADAVAHVTEHDHLRRDRGADSAIETAPEAS